MLKPPMSTTHTSKQKRLSFRARQKPLLPDASYVRGCYGCTSGSTSSCKTSRDFLSGRLKCFSLAITQYIGAPLYLINKDCYYRYMAFLKQGMALLVLSMTQWWTASKVHVSGDESVKDQIRMLPDGRVQCDFADRAVLIANHQVMLNTYPNKKSELTTD